MMCFLKNRILSATEMVLLTLRFFAIGCILQVAGEFSDVDKSTAIRVINKVSRATASMHGTYRYIITRRGNKQFSIAIFQQK